jgi:predicted metalloprotease
MMLFNLNAGSYCSESFTHGTSEQRNIGYDEGYKTGDIKQGNTFDEIR